MKLDTKKYVDEIIDLAHTKSELDQIIFDIDSMRDHLGYKSVTGVSDELEKRRILIEEELDSLGSPQLAKYFEDLLGGEDLDIFEPSRFKALTEDLHKTVSEIVYIKLITAIKLKDKDLKEIAAKQSIKVERKVLIDVSVDKSLIGGAIIYKDNYIMDYSLKNKFSNFESEWKKRIKKA